jgi:pyruvate/2-oxoglutarate dehydrogenase complex dihydrolipoamide acyltransferase (E2) component
MAKEIGSAASDEAKDLGLAATRKMMELGERRRQRRAEKHQDDHDTDNGATEADYDATEAAMRHAEELGVNLSEVEGNGAEGRITVHDVKRAAEEQ